VGHPCHPALTCTWQETWSHCHVGPLAIRSSSPSPTASPLPTRAGGGTPPRSSGRSGSVARLSLLRSTEAQRDPPQWSESCGCELTPRPELPDLRGDRPPARTRSLGYKAAPFPRSSRARHRNPGAEPPPQQPLAHPPPHRAVTLRPWVPTADAGGVAAPLPQRSP
jgi:hypothetical protein